MNTTFRLSFRRPAVWIIAWLGVIVLAEARYGWDYVPALVLGGAIILIVGLWANAGSGITRSIDGSGPTLVLSQVLGGREEIPWLQITEMAVVQRMEMFTLYPILRVRTRNGENHFLPYYLLDDPEGLKALIITRSRLRQAPRLGPNEIESWAAKTEE